VETSSPLWIGPTAGRAPRLETLLASLTASRHFLLSATRDLDRAALTAAPAIGPNTIGMLLSHIAAAERLFVNLTGAGFQFRDDDVDARQAFRFERDPLAGESIERYWDHLAAVREDTAALFAARDDAWLDEPRTFAGRPSNTHYYWLHLLMDEARHVGQIIVLRKYLLPEAAPEFDPYAGL
jgi:uncharacterized damage-inducible protein DinB